MTLILLIWYSLGWFITGAIAKDNGEISLKEILGSFILAPLIGIVIPFYFIEKHGDKIIWRKP